jgi:hypothetical protein
MPTSVFSNEWRHAVRAVPDEEYLADPKPCRVEGCEEPGLFELSWYYRASVAGRAWQRRERVCVVEAEAFASMHQLQLEVPR